MCTGSCDICPYIQKYHNPVYCRKSNTHMYTAAQSQKAVSAGEDSSADQEYFSLSCSNVRKTTEPLKEYEGSVVVSTTVCRARTRNSVLAPQTYCFFFDHSWRLNIVGGIYDKEVALHEFRILCLQGMWHLIHRTILRRLSWASLACICTPEAIWSFRHQWYIDFACCANNSNCLLFS